jgi:methionyl-tRNA synthetase
MSEPYYITTAISYPNGKPHIGHAYEAVAADVIARFQRLSGRDVCFLTGTDEHGLKMVQTARDLRRDTIDLADEMSSYFRDLYAKLNISIDHFCRTTAPHHHRASQEIWKRLEANGDLYLDRYEGWYSVRDEAYYDDSELVEGANGEKVSPQNTPVEWTVEESWFFRLSKYQEPLLKLYQDQPDWIRPESRKNEIERFVEGGLRDLSVSRTSFDWGVKVPGSEGHVMYVWLDALTAYISGIGFPDETDEWKKFWPASLHLIGKDIVRFHTVYWPAFLMSANLPLPKAVFGHGFILARDGQKMSKSAGNSADPLVLADLYGVDQLRYFFMREVSFGQDGSWSEEAIVNRCNAELANSFGNLAQRVLSMIHKNCDGLLSNSTQDEADMALDRLVVSEIDGAMIPAFAELQFTQGLEAWLRAVFACNQYVDEQAPWALKKSDPDRMAVVLTTLFQAIHRIVIAIQPVVPDAAARLLDQMGIAENRRRFADRLGSSGIEQLVNAGYRVAQPVGAFPRLILKEAEDSD